jgi:hypothetical protein
MPRVDLSRLGVSSILADLGGGRILLLAGSFKMLPKAPVDCSFAALTI